MDLKLKIKYLQINLDSLIGTYKMDVVHKYYFLEAFQFI